ncbi:MAG: cation:proton antiporter regulatory subunit, partial [Candidatus Binatia bacterium]
LNVAVWSTFGIASVPLLIALWRSGGELSVALSRRVTGRAEGSRVVAEAFRFALTVVAALVFLAVASPLLPTGLPLLATAGLVGASAFVFWRSLLAVQEEAERVLGAIFSSSEEEEPAPAEARAELANLVSRRYSFEVVLEDFIVPFSDSAVRRTIRDVALRSQTGATIAAIYREAQTIVNPDPDTTLEPGDVLLLLGSQEQVQAAMRHLERIATSRDG